MKIKILSLAVVIASLSVACKQDSIADNSNDSQQKTAIQQKNTQSKRTNAVKNSKQKTKNVANKNAKKTNNALKNKKTVISNNRKNTASTTTKKVASKKIVNPAQKQRDAIAKIKNSNIGKGKINSLEYYAALRRNLDLSDNKLKGLKGINDQFDKKISQIPKVNGKTNFKVLRKINDQRQNTIKMYLGDGIYRQKVTFDAKYSKK